MTRDQFLVEQEGLFSSTQINSLVKNNYGPKKFIVTHSGGHTLKWSASNRAHLDMLLRIEKNMGYILSIDNVREVF